MFQLDIGNYVHLVAPDIHGYSVTTNVPAAVPSGMDEIVKSYDQILHQSLDKIFRDRCLGSSEQFKQFLRGPQHNTDYNSIIEPILEQEPFLSTHYSKEELGMFSLLWIAVSAGYTDSAELLVRSGADINEPFGRHNPQVIDEKLTILHLLLQMKISPENERLIYLATDHGADLQARDHKKRTALHIAVMTVRVQMTELLLKKWADVNATDNDGLTPLLYAVQSIKSNELVPLLLKHGADVFAKDSRGRNAWTYLACSPVEDTELTKVLIEKGVSLEDNTSYHQLMHQATINGKNELVKLLLDYGVDVNTQNEWGTFPLYDAARYGQRTVMETLLKRGANVDLISTYDGRTALHTACESAAWSFEIFEGGNKSESVIRLLLSAGADVLAKNRGGETPFALMLSKGCMNQSATRLMIRVLALKKICQPSIELKDERIIEQYPKWQTYFRECIQEIDRMKSTRFIETCTFFQLLTSSDCQIATLMQNSEFETKFRLYDLNGFSIYAEYLLRAFQRGQKHCQEMLEQANVINEAVYDILPYLVVKKVVQRIFNDRCSDNMMKFNKILE